MARYQNRVRFPHHSALSMGVVIATEEHDRILDLRDEMGLFAAQIRAATALRLPLIYAVLRAEAPVVKIGTSSILPSRRGRLVRFGMNAVRLVAVQHGDHTIEREIHKRLGSSRVRMDGLPGQGATEHFEITPEVVAWLNESRVATGFDPMSTDELLSFSRTCSA